LSEKLMAGRQVLRDAIGVRVVNDRALAETAAALGVFALQQMAFAGVAAHDFAGTGDFKSLGHGLFRFDAFGTSHKFINSITKGRALYAAEGPVASAILNFLTCLVKVPRETRTAPTATAGRECA
jgi:hypothetical protein